MSLNTSFLRSSVFALVSVALAYVISFAVLMQMPGASLEEPLFLMTVLGIAFPLLAWSITRGNLRIHLSRPIATPKRAWPVLLYFLLFAILVLGWGFSALNTALPNQPMQSVAQLLLKLIAMVALPAWLFFRDDMPMHSRFSGLRLVIIFLVMTLAFTVFQAIFSRGLKSIAELAPSMSTLVLAIPACWLWQTIEAGLCEEFLFRRLLQQRLADATGSQVTAIAWASLIFGIAHAPGLWMRGASLLEGVSQPSVPWAIAYSIVMIAPAGIVFGVLWARTRSLWLLVPLHGMVDLIPQLAPFIRAWTHVT